MTRMAASEKTDEANAKSGHKTDFQKLLFRNQRLESELNFLKDVTKRMQEARIGEDDVSSPLPEKNGTTSVATATSRKVRRYKSFSFEPTPKQDKLAMELTTELREEKRKLAELRTVILSLQEEGLAKDQCIAALKEEQQESERQLRLIVEENEQLRGEACKVEDLQETLRTLQERLMKDNDRAQIRNSNDVKRKEAVSPSHASEVEITELDTIKLLKAKVKERDVRLVVLESALKEKMQIISALQSQIGRNAETTCTTEL